MVPRMVHPANDFSVTCRPFCGRLGLTLRLGSTFSNRRSMDNEAFSTPLLSGKSREIVR